MEINSKFNPSDRETEKQWLQALEKLGAQNVAIRLAQTGGGSASDIGGIGTTSITRGFIEDWLRIKQVEKDELETRRYRFVIFWAFIAAVAGVIAAWPIVKEMWK